MNAHPVQLLAPVFDCLDGLIREQGDILFMVFAHVALAVIVWILCGGLRRKSTGNPVPPMIFIHPPGKPPQQPLDTFNPFGPCCNDCRDHDERQWE